MYKWKPKKKILHIVQDIYEWMQFNKKILNQFMQINNEENIKDLIEFLSIEGITGEEKKIAHAVKNKLIFFILISLIKLIFAGSK